MKKAGIWLTILLMLCWLPVAGAEELRGYIKGQGWKYVSFGEYPYERDGTVKPVLWRVLELKDDRLLMITEQVIDTQQVIFEKDKRKIERHDYRLISSYEESDLYGWMNTVALDTLLGDDPARNALIEQPGGGKLFILDMDEFRNVTYGFSANTWGEQPTRQASGTPYAVKVRGLYVDSDYSTGCYWVADVKSPEGYKFALVGYNGHLSWGAYTRVNVGIRPSVRLDMTQMKITGGSGTKKDPFVLESIHDAADVVPTSAPTAAHAEVPAAVLTAEAATEVTAVPASTPAPAAEAAQSPSGSEVLLSFVGDCSIGDSEQFAEYQESYHATVDEKGHAWPFSLVQDYLAADDLTIANLEAVLTNRYAHTDKMYNLKAAPDHVRILTEGSIEMVNTVNNHCMDFHRAGYLDTLETLDEAGIGRFGTIYSWREDGFDDLAVREIDGIRFGFVGFSYPQENDKKRVQTRVKRLKEEMDCDVVIVSLHWGTEEKATPNSGQIVFAKAAIDAGADVVWGHHPHVIQPIHFYQGKPILYSTGNFTFGTMSQVDPATGIFQLAYERAGEDVVLTRLQVIPCQTQGGPDYRPRVLTEEAERRAVFKKLRMTADYARCENLPESFLETGVVYFENGEMQP